MSFCLAGKKTAGTKQRICSRDCIILDSFRNQPTRRRNIPIVVRHDEFRRRVEMNETRRESSRPQSKSPANLKIIKRGFVILSFDGVDSFLLHKPLRQRASEPRKTLSGKFRCTES